MGRGAHRDDAHPDTTGTAATSSKRLIVPSADVLAIVRFDEPPDDVPEELVPYVVAVEGRRPDWQLTDDAVAFGRHHIVVRFTAWRTTWERTWTLDSSSSLARLVGLAGEIEPGSISRRLLAESRDDNDDLILSPRAQRQLVHDLPHLADRIRARSAEGIGIIDRTPGNTVVGLARAWPACGRDEIVAADDLTEIRFVRGVGLVIGSHTHGGHIDRTTIDDVSSDAAGFRVSGPDGSFTVPTERARPLGWLMPGSTAWRVRPIPEILAWARTFAGLEEAMAYAIDLGLDLRLTRHRPIAP